jgi:hypothetical protein
MLSCNVSQRARRAAIAADVAEAAVAADQLGTGNVVFATLVDDPASVGETVDAYLGEIMLEAASAAATVNAGLIYATAIDEAVTATEAWQAKAGSILPDVDILETAAADSTQDATMGAPMIARSAMVGSVFVNSPGTVRQAYVDSIMINL